MSAYVAYFGGFQASIPQVKSWAASAMKQNPGLTIDAYPYPDASSNGADAIQAFTDNKTHDFAEAVKKIEASQCDKVFIVGHSSGCAIANAVDAKIKDNKKIILVVLDGYGPSDAQLARRSTQVWIAKGGAGKSLHHDDLQDWIKDYNKRAKEKDRTEVKTFTASSDCTTKLALHFSLVNRVSSNALVKLIADGYTNCDANLCWVV